MSRCRCCGGKGFEDRYFCASCQSLWLDCPERKRAQGLDGARPAMAAVMDFINRTRAERQNGARP